jgi:hypothetical protein
VISDRRRESERGIHDVIAGKLKQFALARVDALDHHMPL